MRVVDAAMAEFLNLAWEEECPGDPLAMGTHKPVQEMHARS